MNSPYFKGTKRTMFGQAEDMTLASPAFNNNGNIPAKYTCDAENQSPPLTFNGVPYGSKSLVLIVEDRDSNPSGFTHWVMFNINPYTNEIPENFISDNVAMGVNDFGQDGYGGPCPQSGTHRYVFKLYAINTILLLQRGATKAQVLSDIGGHVIEEAELTGLYKRQ
ncbi:YbhB/YbcL family Raf kinase inhibitor-like protein [Patescibacteria group bacterium]|nr:YbhB/YbcL family Raf kinase inhibitor-like protein [Patescibacteria group bacterium]